MFVFSFIHLFRLRSFFTFCPAISGDRNSMWTGLFHGNFTTDQTDDDCTTPKNFFFNVIHRYRILFNFAMHWNAINFVSKYLHFGAFSGCESMVCRCVRACVCVNRSFAYWAVWRPLGHSIESKIWSSSSSLSSRLGYVNTMGVCVCVWVCGCVCVRARHWETTRSHRSLSSYTQPLSSLSGTAAAEQTFFRLFIIFSLICVGAACICTFIPFYGHE